MLRPHRACALCARCLEPLPACTDGGRRLLPLVLPRPRWRNIRVFVGGFLARASATQAEQPHWVTPLVTVTPRLEQEFRTDFLSQPQGEQDPAVELRQWKGPGDHPDGGTRS